MQQEQWLAIYAFVKIALLLPRNKVTSVYRTQRVLFACVHQNQKRHKQESAEKRVEVYLKKWNQAWRHRCASALETWHPDGM